VSARLLWWLRRDTAEEASVRVMASEIARERIRLDRLELPAPDKGLVARIKRGPKKAAPAGRFYRPRKRPRVMEMVERFRVAEGR
jgi:hypothetical protein